MPLLFRTIISYLFHATANQVTVTVAVIDLRHVREEFRLADEIERERRFLAGIRMRPFAADLDCCVRSVHHDVVRFARSGGLLAFALDLDERGDEAVHFGLRLRNPMQDQQGLV